MLETIKNRTKRLLGPKLLGALDYYRFPGLRQSWGGPLNGQRFRQKMVASMINELKPDAVVETGTFRATSTEYFASLCRGQIYTIEADDRLYGYCRMRLAFRKTVHLIHDDSRKALRSLIANPHLAGKRILFYLDAHWGADLPLAEELDLVFGNWDKSLVLIDDFQVVDDSGYTYDDYGRGKALTLEYIERVREKYGLSVFFPAARSVEESGAKRGCVVLAANKPLTRELQALDMLRRYPTNNT